jgi:hypothetical protein
MMFSLFQSCKTNEDSSEPDLRLKAPNGEMIAGSMSSFREEVSSVIEEIYGERKEFKIVKLEFSPDILQGYLAEIEYETYDGLSGNYFKVYGLKEYILSTYGSIVIPNSEMWPESGGIAIRVSYYYCKKSSDNACNKCRMVRKDTPDIVQLACVCDDGDGKDCDLYEKYGN